MELGMEGSLGSWTAGMRIGFMLGLVKVAAVPLDHYLSFWTGRGDSTRPWHPKHIGHTASSRGDLLINNQCIESSCSGGSEYYSVGQGCKSHRRRIVAEYGDRVENRNNHRHSILNSVDSAPAGC